MSPSEALKPHANRIARLLADARGAQILAEMQRLRASLREPGTSPAAAPAADGTVGIWRAETTADGVALRRRDVNVNPWHWSDAEFVPPPGAARRVALIGESVARGWGYDPVLNPAMALRRGLEAAAPGGYQCVDLAQAGAMVEDLTGLIGRLPVIEPDIVVALAGNNWGCFPSSPSSDLLGDLAEVVRERGYAAMRRRFIDTVMVPRAHAFVAALEALHDDHGVPIVMVIPPFNLRGWAPQPNVDVPVLAADRLTQWYELYDRAERAGTRRRWADSIAAAEKMAGLDGGTSPVPGRLVARAAAALGDGAAVRAGLEASRDALAGLGMGYTPRIVGEIREVLTGFARRRGLRCVDLDAVLASDDVAEVPDARFFFDYCHLSDEGIERAMGAVADAVLELPSGTTAPSPPADPGFSALMRIVAAAQGAFLGQPPEYVAPHLRLALAADPASAKVMAWLLEVLEGTGPMWARGAVEPLAEVRPLASLFGHVALSTAMPPELWALRACLGDVLGRTPARIPETLDLLAAPFGDGQRPPSLVPGRAHHQATARHSRLAFGVGQPADGRLSLTYRMPPPADSAATVAVNGEEAGTLPPTRTWAKACLALPATLVRPGVNWLSIRWPVPGTDGDRALADDAAAMTRGELPFVLPVFGEVFDARLALGRPSPPAAHPPSGPDGSPR